MSDFQLKNKIDINGVQKPQISFGENSALAQIKERQQEQPVSGIPANPIYQYPQTNIYPQNQTTIAKQDDAIVLNPSEHSPVNVYITNPAGYMGPNYYTGQYYPQSSNIQTSNTQSTAVPAASLEDKKNKKTKRIVEITDDYVKSLENYLRNSNKDTRLTGVKELVKRFEEDKSRYDDPALTALLNIALQDKSSSVRSLALSLADSGIVKGDENTLNILKGLTTSQSKFGTEAESANSALLKMSATTKEVEDDSPEKRNSVVYKL